MEQPGKYSNFNVRPDLIGSYTDQILKKQGKSRADLQREIGYSYNIINALITGEAKVVRADLLTKLCMFLDIPMQDMILHAIDGEKEKHIDDLMRIFNAPPSIPAQNNTSHANCPSLDIFIKQLQQQQELTMNRYKDLHSNFTQHITMQHEEALNLMRERHEASVAYLKEKNSDLIKQLESRTTQVKRLRRWLTIITSALVFSVIALVVTLIISMLLF